MSNGIDIPKFLQGNKTFMIVVGLLVYIGVNMVNKTEADPNIVYALLGGSLWTLRLGVKNGSNEPKPKVTPPT